MKKYKIALNPYNTHLRVLVATPEEARSNHPRTIYSNADFSYDLEGAVLHAPGCFPLLWVNSERTKDQQLQTVCHELVHVINRVFYECGIDPDQHNDEAFAYMMSFLITEFQKRKII